MARQVTRVRPTMLNRGSVSRETKEPATAEPAKASFVRSEDFDEEDERAVPDESPPTQADISVCAVARRTGFMLRTLLQVWQASVPDQSSDRTVRIRDAVEAAADLLVEVYAEP